MNQLIVFRGLQGVAGGVLTSTIFTVISQIFPPAERARFQGLFSGIFGLASIVGPLIGGYLTDNLSWRWVFYVNLPIGMIALTVLLLSFPNIKPEARARHIDFLGAGLLILGVVPLLLALSWGGNSYPWNSPMIIGLFIFSAVMLVIFGLAESRALEPIIPLNLFKNSIVSWSIVAMMVMAAGMFGAILFIPLYIQGVIGTNATQSGTVMIPMMVTMIGSSIVGGQIIARTGRYKLAGLLGMMVMTIGLYLLSQMGADADYLTVTRNMIILGIGMGPTMPVFTLASQNAVKISQLGVVTSLTQFARSMGSTIGVALFGAILTNQFTPAFHEALVQDVVDQVPPQVLAQFDNPQVLLSPDVSAALHQQVLALGANGTLLFNELYSAIQVGLVAALHDVFLLGAILGVFGVIAVLFIKEIPLRKSYASTAIEPSRETAAQVGQDAYPSLPPLKRDDQPPAKPSRETGLVA
jgi:EmrB/QacA subfamily drug resistance transporter